MAFAAISSELEKTRQVDKWWPATTRFHDSPIQDPGTNTKCEVRLRSYPGDPEEGKTDRRQREYQLAGTRLLASVVDATFETTSIETSSPGLLPWPMHTALNRANSLLTLSTTAIAVLCALASLTDVVRTQHPTAKATVLDVLGLQACGQLAPFTAVFPEQTSHVHCWCAPAGARL